MVDLSIVVLAYRSEEYLKEFAMQIIEELSNESVQYELIIVANYDSLGDKTPQIAEEIANQYSKVRCLAQEKQGKMGWDMRMGLDACNGKVLLVIDGDGQMPSSDIMNVYQALVHGNYDLVKTFRAVRMDGCWRRLMSKGYNRLFHMFYPMAKGIQDVNSKPKAFTQEAYNRMDLTSNDWFTDSEIMIQALVHKMRICEIGTTFYKNERRASFVKLSTALEFLLNLIHYRFIKKR